MNSPATLCLSPAHKRKPSPTSCLGASKSKKLDLDDEMLIAASASIEIKKENIDPDEQEALENIELLSLLDVSLKQESAIPVTATDTPTHANTTTAMNVDDFQSNIKMESSNADMDRSVMESKFLDADLQMQLADQANSNKFLFYWFDLFEDQFNSNGTVYLFGKMPVKKKREENTESGETVKIIKNNGFFC